MEIQIEISVKELRAIAHNTPEAMALQERVDALMQEVDSLKGAKRQLVDSLVEDESFKAKAKAAKLELINQAVLAVINERGADAVLQALAGAGRGGRPVKVNQPTKVRDSAPNVVNTVNPMELNNLIANTAVGLAHPKGEESLPEPEEVLYEETVVLVPEIDEDI